MNQLDLRNLKRGDTVYYAFPDSGYPSEAAAAAETLDPATPYTVAKVDAHGWFTDLYLAEFPGKHFNSVLFGRPR